MRHLQLHPWNVSVAEAAEIQRSLRSRVSLVGEFDEPRLVAGVDISVPRGSSTGRAAVVILSYPDLELVEVRHAVRPLEMPYIPGYLSFRETPIALDAFERVRNEPDIVLVDGQGIAHPRGLGIASHLGLVLDKQTVGCAKSRLTGRYTEPGIEKGSVSPLVDSGGNRIGDVVRTRTGVKPLFISPGHRIGFEGAVEAVLRCTTTYRLPEPTRIAHVMAGASMEQGACGRL